MTLVWDYDADLFGEDVARLLSGRFLDLLRAYLDTPQAPLADLAPAAVEAAAEAVPVPAGRDLLDPVAAHHPSLPALLCGARRVTYGELDGRVASLAERLRAAGITPGLPVAVVLPRGADSVVALLACLRTGAVYCPLSPADPPARIALLVERLAPALVLIGEGGPALPDSLPTARIDAPVLPRAHTADVLPATTYVIHTSGSTGTPKPVAVGRAALEHHLTAMADRFALSSADRVLMFAQPSFDVALEEVLPTLHAGACLVVPEHEVPTGPELAELLAAARVTVANLPTSYFLSTREELRPALRDESWAPRLLVLGGERLPAETLRGILADTDATVLNAYGVTEAAISSTVHEISRDALTEGAEIPLGTELPGERVHVLDAYHRPLPVGGVGELAIAGPGLAEGYPGNPEVTAARFIAVDALGGQRVYLTGDLGYRGLDGLLYFLGRRDNQVKLRGHRIELEEIEAAASAALGGRSCAVVLDRDSPAAPRLVGFFEDGADLSDVDEKALHTELSHRLPGPLVPARWARLQTMPTLAGGKPDRTVLARRAAALDPVAPAAPETETASGHEQAAAVPDDPMTALLVNGWREVLGHSRFDTASHFFHIGGHSLLAAELAAWLEPHLGTRPPLKVLFRNPVLADQADALAATAPASTES